MVRLDKNAHSKQRKATPTQPLQFHVKFMYMPCYFSIYIVYFFNIWFGICSNIRNSLDVKKAEKLVKISGHHFYQATLGTIFTRIFRNFVQIFSNPNFWGCACTLTSNTTAFHNSIIGNFVVYQDRLETNLLQLLGHPKNSEWFSIISVTIFEVNIVD